MSVTGRAAGLTEQPIEKGLGPAFFRKQTLTRSTPTLVPDE